MYVLLCYTLYRADKNNKALYVVIYLPRKFAIYFIIQILGFVVDYFYPPAIIFSVILATAVWIIPERRAEQVIKKQNKKKRLQRKKIRETLLEEAEKKE